MLRTFLLFQLSSKVLNQYYYSTSSTVTSTRLLGTLLTRSTSTFFSYYYHYSVSSSTLLLWSLCYLLYFPTATSTESTVRLSLYLLPVCLVVRYCVLSPLSSACCTPKIFVVQCLYYYAPITVVEMESSVFSHFFFSCLPLLPSTLSVCFYVQILLSLSLSSLFGLYTTM
jgi:hypothetical protein